MKSSTILDRIRNLLDTTAPFNILDEETRAGIVADVSVEYFEPGEILLAQGTSWAKGLFIVESGLVRLLDVEAQRLIDKCSEGDTFGAFSLLKGGALTYEAKAVEPTVCALIKGERFQELYDTHTSFAAFIDEDLKRYVRRLGSTIDVAGAYRLFSVRLSQLALRGVVTCTPTSTVEEAARAMAKADSDSILVIEDERPVGLLTDSDLRTRILAQGRPATTPVSQVMSTPIHTISNQAYIFDGMMRLLQLRVHRLAVVEPGENGGSTVSLLTDRDVAHFRGQDPVATVRRVDKAPSLSELADIRSETNELMLRLYRQGVEPEQLIGILSIIYDRIVVRVLELVEEELRDQEASPGLAWTWVRLGSGGRSEMALSTKQHNALIYANPPDDETADQAERWFAQLAERANEALERCGFLNSVLVARDPYCRNTLRAWKKQYRTWIFESKAEELTALPFMFFDLRPVYGDFALADALRQDIADALNVQAMDEKRSFIAMMAANALEASPPLSGFFQRFELERSGEHRNTFDIRTRGILPVADAARTLALELRDLDSTNTFDRLRHIADSMEEMRDITNQALNAYKYIFDFRLEHQLRSVEGGEPPHNNISPMALTKIQQNLIREAFTTVDAFQKAFADHYGLSRSRWL